MPFEPTVQTASPTTALTSDAISMAADMAQVDAVIARRLRSDVALIDQIAQLHHRAPAASASARGWCCCFAGALGFDGPERHELAAIVEFIHTATLLHDDVVDESALRRGRATANAMFGNAASVLVGDFLYSRAFQMMVAVEPTCASCEVLADATNVIAEGEVLQLMNMHDPDLAVDDYLRVIRFKTAKLFEASARLGAILAGAERRDRGSLRRLRPLLGTAFQLDRRRARLRRRQPRAGQERRRRPARRQADLAAAARDAARRRRPSATLIRHAIEHGEVAPPGRHRRASSGAPARWRRHATRRAREADQARACLRQHCRRRSQRDALLELCVRSVDRSS